MVVGWLVAGGALLVPAVGLATPTQACGSFESISRARIDGNLKVDGFCELSDSEVTGKVIVTGAGQLFAYYDSMGELRGESGSGVDGSNLTAGSITASAHASMHLEERIDASLRFTDANLELEGEGCAEVLGDVVMRGGSLESECGEIQGNLNTKGTSVELGDESLGGPEGLTVTGSMRMTRGDIRMEGVYVDGDVVIQRDHSIVQVLENRAADMTITRNTATSPARMVVAGNEIAGRLRCARNVPAPTDREIPNTAADLEGQCSAL